MSAPTQLEIDDIQAVVNGNSVQSVGSYLSTIFYDALNQACNEFGIGMAQGMGIMDAFSDEVSVLDSGATPNVFVLRVREIYAEQNS